MVAPNDSVPTPNAAATTARNQAAQNSTAVPQPQPPPLGDRLTQIQDCLDKMTEIFFNSVGVLQRDAPLVPLNDGTPVTAWTDEQVAKNTEETQRLATEAARDVVQTAKIIDFLIDRLPGVKHTEEEQMAIIARLEDENRIAGEEMEATIQAAETLSAEVKEAIRFIEADQIEYYRTLDY
ncbi:Mediator of RNA polymerase II transcription subunit 21 [Irineochytrium annulatum]|nr:Mediator of RNA polymerase II transcription subunit 21 [Irineochytrium annulatum]